MRDFAVISSTHCCHVSFKDTNQHSASAALIYMAFYIRRSANRLAKACRGERLGLEGGYSVHKLLFW